MTKDVDTKFNTAYQKAFEIEVRRQMKDSINTLARTFVNKLHRTLAKDEKFMTQLKTLTITIIKEELPKRILNDIKTAKRIEWYIP